MADGDDRVSVKHRKCCDTLFSGRLIRFTLFRVAVNHGSTLEFRTMVGADRGAKAAAEAGNNTGGILMVLCECHWLATGHESSQRRNKTDEGKLY